MDDACDMSALYVWCVKSACVGCARLDVRVDYGYCRCACRECVLDGMVRVGLRCGGVRDRSQFLRL